MKAMNIAKLGTNYFYSLLYRLSICILPLIVTPYLSRVLSPDDNGLYVYTSTIACFFIMFCKLGLESYGNRSISSCRDDIMERSKAFVSIYCIQVFSSLISIVTYVLLTIFIFEGNKTIYWIQLMYVCTGLFDVSWFFYGLEQFKTTTIRSLITRGMVIVGVFALVRNADDVLPYTFIMSIYFLIEQLILFFIIPRYIKPCKVNINDIVVHIKPNLKLFIPIMAINIYHWIDKLMLGTFCTQSDVAYYNYAESIVMLPKGLLQALGSVMLPRVTYLIANNYRKKCFEMLSNSIEFIVLISCGMCFGIIGVASEFVPFFLGKMYKPSVILVVELAVVMIPMGISDLIQNQYLVPFRLDNLNMTSVTVGVLLNIVFNTILIPIIGASGAVVATIIAELCVCVFLCIKIRKVISIKKLIACIIPYFVAGVAEAGAAMAISVLNVAAFTKMIIQAIAAIITYLLIISIYFAFCKRINSNYINPIYRLKNSMESVSLPENKD